MVTIQHSTIHKKVACGVEQAKSVSRSVIVSTSTKVDYAIDPVAFYRQGENRIGERFFWAAPNGDFVMVGVGSAHTLVSNSDNCFKQFEKDWQELLNYSTADQIEEPGVGPVLFGAFSFDPKKEKTNLWRNFPIAKMVLPQHVLTITKDECWLTVNMMVDQNTNAEHLADAILKEQQNLLQNLTKPTYNPSHRELTIEELDKDEWIASVDKVAGQIRSSEIEKVVLAREIRVKSDRPFITEEILDRLLTEQPISYIFALEGGEDCFMGASPERLVKKQGKEAFSTCLAGSIGRGSTPEEDYKLGNELLNDAKNLHEHEVVVRAITSAFEQGCERISVPEKPILYKIRDIQHLYTPVVGEVKKNVSLLTLVEKLHPTPALGGHPKEEALQKIRTIERLDRGLYAGPIGWLDSKGNGEFAVAIRSALVQGKEASLFAGCGIVGDSDPASEYKETQMKFRPMLSALGGFSHEFK
ncbi:isochorismate synthase [Calidifontibacillus erzurumensis]|uniref:Isochorismate synthase MenF n=1 Tax=Calidifontibacillus erzurumensis TaxID=2741433 RepID=A0A8J8GGI4_9BACI|nr:isochorismate synthase [Calidifontibacillus erzurumensis]NSL51373.1 isochorismate synthase [Calidifontibacillus erzurumensis]